MKKTLALLLLLALAAMPALAEEPLAPAAGEAVAVDLDGDGAGESISWAYAPGDYDEVVTLTVTAADGASCEYATEIVWNEVVDIVDLDGDGQWEILVSGDVMSDDYCAWCLRWDGDALYEVLFPDSGRVSATDGYYLTGYGQITAISGNAVTLSGSQDVLGTWFGARTFELGPHDRFEFCDDGLWVRDIEEIDDGLWEYGALTVAAPLEYADLDGNPAGTLQPGDKILIVASDKQDMAQFITPDGTEGVLAISPNYEKGWGLLVDGVSEDECFEYVPYAD